MKRYPIIVITVLVLAALGLEMSPNIVIPRENASKAPISELFRRDANLFEPNWIKADDGHRLWVSDATHQTLTFYEYDLQTDNVLRSIRMGRGPGELSEVGMKWMSRISSGDRVLYDAGSYRMQRYTAELDKSTPIRLTTGSSQWLNAHILSDTLLVVSPMSMNQVIQIYHFDPGTNQVGRLMYQLSISERPELNALSNFLLKNGHIALSEDAIYFSFLFAPYIVKVNQTGLQWIGGREGGMGFPVNSKNPNEIRMPDASQHPQQTISIAADTKRVYVLHNGEKAGFWKTIWSTITNDFSDIDEQLNASNRLRIYDATIGILIEEWELPVRARLISVHREFIYLTTQLDGQPTVIAYRMNR